MLVVHLVLATMHVRWFTISVELGTNKIGDTRYAKFSVIPNRYYYHTTYNEKERIITCMCVPFIEHKSLEILCNSKVTKFCLFHTRISFRSHEWVQSTSLEMPNPQTYMHTRFFLCWMGLRYFPLSIPNSGSLSQYTKSRDHVT